MRTLAVAFLLTSLTAGCPGTSAGEGDGDGCQAEGLGVGSQEAVDALIAGCAPPH